MDRWCKSASHLKVERWSLPLLLRLLGHCMRAVYELGLARGKLSRLEAREIAVLNADAGAHGRSHAKALASDEKTLDWISFVIPRVAARLPWRSDCLVQALAAQKWLKSKSISTAIVIGVEKPDRKSFGAHAWLEYGPKIVTGGDVDQYTVLLESEKPADSSGDKAGNQDVFTGD